MPPGDGPWSYDLIAEVYDTDMGSNLSFDDGAFYAGLCRQRSGRVLELGCGAGRVQLRLMQEGFDVVGLDRSLPMLRQLRRAAKRSNLEPLVVQADARHLPFEDAFEVLLAPFSMIVYAVTAQDLKDVFSSARRALHAGGLLAVDAFVPKDVAAWRDFRRDYVRPHGDGQLERLRKITPIGDGSNVVERIYRLKQGDSHREWRTLDHIRPYRGEDLRQCAQDSGFKAVRSVLDYGNTTQPLEAEFETVIFEAS